MMIPRYLCLCLALGLGALAPGCPGARSVLDTPDVAVVDGGPPLDPSGNHPCFGLNERACNRYGPHDDSRGCFFMNQYNIDICAANVRFPGCSPYPRFVHLHNQFNRLFGCNLERPCPHGSKWCVVGDCEISGGNAGTIFAGCWFPMEDTDPAPGYNFPEDHSARCIPVDADPADFGCAVYEVRERE